MKKKLQFFQTERGARVARNRWQIRRAVRIELGLCIRDAVPLSKEDKAGGHVICADCRRIMNLKFKARYRQKVLGSVL